MLSLLVCYKVPWETPKGFPVTHALSLLRSLWNDILPVDVGEIFSQFLRAPARAHISLKQHNPSISNPKKNSSSCLVRHDSPEVWEWTQVNVVIRIQVSLLLVRPTVCSWCSGRNEGPWIKVFNWTTPCAWTHLPVLTKNEGFLGIRGKKHPDIQFLPEILQVPQSHCSITSAHLPEFHLRLNEPPTPSLPTPLTPFLFEC